jgi:hypothetical protein
MLVWANGPGLRWFLDLVIRQQLEAQQLTGTFEVRGTALSGVSLHHIALSGSGIIRQAESDLIAIDWSLSSLFKKEIESLTLTRLRLTLNPEAAPPTTAPNPAPDPDGGALPETLNLVRGILHNAEVSLSDLRIELDGVPPLTLASLTHQAGEESYFIRDFKTRDHLDRLIHNPATTVTWTGEGFRADVITVRPDLALTDLLFFPSDRASAVVDLSGFQVALASDLKTSHQITLRTPGLPITALTQLAHPGLPVEGLIESLTIDSSRGLVDLRVTDLEWEDYRLNEASLRAQTPDLLSPFDQVVELALTLDQVLVLNGTLVPNRTPLDSSADLTFTVNWPEAPTVKGEMAFDSREIRLLAECLETLRLTARYRVDSQTYQAEALARIKEASTITAPLVGPLNFSARAKGDLNSGTHTGSLDLTELNLRQPEFPEASASATVSWDWPKRVSVEKLALTSPEGLVKTSLAWQDDTLSIPRFELSKDEQSLLALTATLPAPLDFNSIEDLLESESPASLKITSIPLSFKTLATFAPLPEGLAGIFQADLTLGGSLARPTLDGFATLDDFRVDTVEGLPPVDLDLKFKTDHEVLSLTAEAREPAGPLFEVIGRLPFRPRAWLDGKADPTLAEVSLTAKTPEIDLKRFQLLVPEITQIDGTASLDLAVSGTLANPDLKGSARADLKRMRLEGSPISNFRNSSLRAKFIENRIIVEPSTINASGGTATLSGSINLASAEPSFDLALTGKYLPLYRNPDFSFRGHPKLKLTGTPAKATISGTLEIAESLIYKDVEILPFGVSRTSEIPQPNLPTFVPQEVVTSASRATSDSGPMNWDLDLQVSTLDPVLIRGNLAKGQITGTIKVGGTLGNPTTSGTLSTQDLVADLPFSELAVQTGVITLRPESLTNPLINLRGSSKVGQYTIQVYLSGPVQDPKLILTSDPPMPESEIMLLLATGSASDQLANQQLASQKALQFLFEGLRRRNRDKDKSFIQRLIKNSNQIKLSLGDTNRFSGRRFSSATLGIADQWDFTTQIDDQGQTRALVIFSVRIK